MIHCSFCFKMLLSILLFPKISFLVLWNDVNVQTESIGTDFWRELENVLCNSLDFLRLLSEIKYFKWEVLKDYYKRNWPLGNLALMLVFPQSKWFWQLKLCGNPLLPLVDYFGTSSKPCQCHTYSQIFLLYSKKLVFIFQSFNIWFSGAFFFTSLLWENLWLWERASGVLGAFFGFGFGGVF